MAQKPVKSMLETHTKQEEIFDVDKEMEWYKQGYAAKTATPYESVMQEVSIRRNKQGNKTSMYSR